MVGTDERLQHLAAQAAYRLIAALEGRGVLDDSQTDPPPSATAALWVTVLW